MSGGSLSTMTTRPTNCAARPLIPGYGSVVAIMWLSEQRFVSIAIDAGGVATGPLATTFLLALAIGASSAVGW